MNKNGSGNDEAGLSPGPVCGNIRRVGSEWEQIAGRFLKGKGYRILTFNFRTRQGEIDLIAMDGDVLVFVEVKYRKNISAGWPQEAVSLKKQRAISHMAGVYLSMIRASTEQKCRFDVVTILGEEIRLFQNAFEYQPSGLSWL